MTNIGVVCLAKVLTSPFPNTIFCHCSAEFHKQYFEAALGQPVNVELVQSIISGALHCEFVIHICES